MVAACMASGMRVEQVAELQRYYETATLPGTVKLTEAETIVDVPKMVSWSFSVILSNNPDRALPAFERLQQLKQILSHGTF